MKTGARDKLAAAQAAMVERQPFVPEPQSPSQQAKLDRLKRLTPNIKKDYGEGMSVNALSEKYKVARQTISRMLGEEKHSGRDAAWRIIERRLPIIAEKVSSAAIKSKRFDDGFRILEKAGVFPAEPQSPTSINDVRLQLAIQNLLPSNAVNPNAVVTPAEQKVADRVEIMVPSSES